jgi:hypothetical protein
VTGRAARTHARAGGVLYLFIIVAALFGEAYVRGTLVVHGDAAATAANLVRSETLFRVGLAGEMLTCVCDVALAMILFVLLEPVSRSLALVGALLRVTYTSVYAVSKLFEIAALVLLGRADITQSQALAHPQSQALALASLEVHSLGYGASLVFFGFCTLVFGELVRRSGYLPRAIGVLLIVAGVGYVVFSVAQMLSPAFAAAYLFPWAMLPGFPAELGLALWLTVRGVDVAKWERRQGQFAGTQPELKHSQQSEAPQVETQPSSL